MFRWSLSDVSWVIWFCKEFWLLAKRVGCKYLLAEQVLLICCESTDDGLRLFVQTVDIVIFLGIALMLSSTRRCKVVKHLHGSIQLIIVKVGAGEPVGKLAWDQQFGLTATNLVYFSLSRKSKAASSDQLVLSFTGLACRDSIGGRADGSWIFWEYKNNLGGRTAEFEQVPFGGLIVSHTLVYSRTCVFGDIW